MPTINSTGTVSVSERFEAFKREGSLSPSERVALIIASLVCLGGAAIMLASIYPGIPGLENPLSSPRGGIFPAVALTVLIILPATASGISGLYVAATAPSTLENKETTTPEVAYGNT